MGNTRSVFGAYLKRHRQRAGWSQGRLAQELGVTNTYIHLLEKGRVDAPTDRRCEQLAGALALDEEEVRDLARKERLARYVERQGWQTGTGTTVEGEDLLGELSAEERALIELVRSLDDEARSHLESTLYLLLRDRDDPAVLGHLEAFAGSRG